MGGKTSSKKSATKNKQSSGTTRKSGRKRAEASNRKVSGAELGHRNDVEQSCKRKMIVAFRRAFVSTLAVLALCLIICLSVRSFADLGEAVPMAMGAILVVILVGFCFNLVDCLAMESRHMTVKGLGTLGWMLNTGWMVMLSMYFWMWGVFIEYGTSALTTCQLGYIPFCMDAVLASDGFALKIPARVTIAWLATCVICIIIVALLTLYFRNKARKAKK